MQKWIGETHWAPIGTHCAGRGTLTGLTLFYFSVISAILLLIDPLCWRYKTCCRLLRSLQEAESLNSSPEAAVSVAVAIQAVA